MTSARNVILAGSSTVTNTDLLQAPARSAGLATSADARQGQAVLSGEASPSYRPLLWILITGAILRAGLVAWLGSEPPTIHDAQDYNGLAIRLVETGGYISESGERISLRPPLFPAIVAANYRVFGIENFLAVSIFHAVLSLATVVLAYWLGTQVYSRQAGLLAAAGTCFYPSLLAYNQFLLSEVLFTFFVTLGALLTVLLVKRADLGKAALLGFTLGLGALTRSVLWLFGPVLAVAIAVVSPGRRTQRLAHSALLMAVFAATVAPWARRNTVLHKTLTIVDVMGGRNVMMGNYEYTPLDRSWATIETETGDRAWHRVLARKVEGYDELTQGQRDKVAMSYGINYFFSHPGQSLLRSTVKFFNYWQLEREIVAGLRQGMFGDLSLLATLAGAGVVCGCYAATLFAALYGMLVAPPANRGSHLMMLLWIAFPCAIHTIAFAHSRYHLPFVPILLVYAAGAVTQRAIVWDRRRTWPFALATLACGLIIASWVREFLVLDLKWFV